MIYVKSKYEVNSNVYVTVFINIVCIRECKQNIQMYKLLPYTGT
jgi:hypothetical protein